jgi:hypothetical protein
VRIDADFIRERWPFDWMRTEPWINLWSMSHSPQWNDAEALKCWFRPFAITNKTGVFVDAYRVYQNRRELRERIKPGVEARCEVPMVKAEYRQAFPRAALPFDLWEFRTSQSDEVVGMAIVSPLDPDSHAVLDQKPSVPVQVGSKPLRIINATPLEIKLDYDVTDLRGDSVQRKIAISLAPLQSSLLDGFPATEIGNIRLALKAGAAPPVVSLDLHPSSPPVTITPGSVQWPPNGLVRIGERRESTPPPHDQSFLSHGTVRREFSDHFFNGRKNSVLREAEIAGPTLIWGSDPILQNYYGLSAADMKSLTIYADRMVVDAPLRFPGTNVTIYARQLEFSGAGCIDTTPLDFAARAESEYFIKDPEDLTNDRLPADKYGKPTYAAANGAGGQKGGDITVYAQKVLDEPGNRTARRFISRGGNGQGGEAGRLKNYVPNDGSRHTTYQKSNAVTAQALGEFFQEKNVFRDRQDYWRWPGKAGENERSSEVDWTSKINVQDAAHRNVLQTGNCVAVALYAYCDEQFPKVPWKERGFLPSRDYTNGPPSKWNEFDAANPGPFPCDGRDAFQGGWPGDGGNGGKIVLHIESGSVPQAQCDVSPGEPGGATAEVAGADPPGPVPAYEMEIKIVRSSFKESSRKTSAALRDVTGKSGQKAKGRQIYVGPKPSTDNDLRPTEAKAGSFECTPLNDFSWAQPPAVGAVLRYAQTAYRNGFRDKAGEALTPYLAMSAPDPVKSVQAEGRLGLLLAKMGSMRDNLASNLDYYGNPPGWVPRLNALTNLELLKSVRQAAYGTFYFAQKMLNDYDALADARDLSQRTSTALVEELETARANLAKAYQELPTAITELDRVQQDIGPVQDKISTLRDRAFDKTKSTVVAQRVFSAGMQILGGIGKALPVGQPFVGLAGSAFDAASQIDWNAEDPLKSARSSIDSLSKAVTSFTKEKKDQVAAVVGGDLLEVERKEDEVTNLTRRLADEEKKCKDAAEATEAEWNKFKIHEQERLDRQIEQVDLAIRDLAPAAKPEKQPNEKETDDQYKLRLEAYVKREAEKADEKRTAESFRKSLQNQKDSLTPKVDKLGDAIAKYQLRQVDLDLKASQLGTTQNSNLAAAAGRVHGSQVPPAVKEKWDAQKALAALANEPHASRDKIAAERDLQDQKKTIERREKTAKQVMTNLEGLGEGLVRQDRKRHRFSGHAAHKGRSDVETPG